MAAGKKTDVLVVGAGIVGLACALVAVEQGLSVQVVEREAFCTGASIRNFGLVSVTGQRSGASWQRARRSRDIWAHVAPKAGIRIEHAGLHVLAQRVEAEQLLREMLPTEQGQQLAWLTPQQLQQHAPQLAHAHIRGALYSPHELRVDARFAIGKLSRWLASRGVLFHMGQAVQQVESGRVQLHAAALQAERIVVCPGPDIRSLFPERFASRQTQLCQLQMLRVRPTTGYRLGTTVMSDLSLVRYPGFGDLPGARRLHDRLRQEQPDALRHGIHLIVVQSDDASLVVGDSHQYGAAMPPFVPAEAEELILREMQRVLCLGHYAVEQRWTGLYPSAAQDAFFETVLPGVQLLSVTSGTGMGSAFALAEECLQGQRIAI